jgi:hypothetical protein
MDALMLMLVGWINLHTEYDTRIDLPNIVITEQGNMCSLYGIKDKGACKATQLKGFYNRKNTIFLHENFDPHNPDDQSRLMHELVHYIQWHNGRGDDDCWGHLEVEAYTLQDAWRMENDINKETDPFKLVMLEAACEDS